MKSIISPIVKKLYKDVGEDSLNDHNASMI